jgi:short-subunit dehydrogenase
MEKNDYALVTGSSGGIGLELAKLLAKDGHNLVLVARSADKLNNLSSELKRSFNIDIKVLPKDLTAINAASEIYDELKKDNLHINILINNAGYGGSGKFAETDLNYELNMMKVNMSTLVELTKLFLPQMIQDGNGKIMNVASTAAFVPGPLMAIYYATKAFVLSFSEAISNELKNSGVTVTALCPGPTRTGFAKTAGVEGANLFSSNIMNAESVALTGYTAMLKGKTVVIPGIKNRLLNFSVRFSPRKTVSMITRRMQEKRK